MSETGAASAAPFVVETARLALRPWTLDDAAVSLAIFGDARVWTHLSAARVPPWACTQVLARCVSR